MIALARGTFNCPKLRCTSSPTDVELGPPRTTGNTTEPIVDAMTNRAPIERPGIARGITIVRIAVNGPARRSFAASMSSLSIIDIDSQPVKITIGV